MEYIERERHFRSKFDAGRKYLHRMFVGEPPVEIEQIALILGDVAAHPHTIAGGRLLSVTDLLTSILQHMARSDAAAAIVPDLWPVIRTLQLVASVRQRRPEAANSSA